MTKVTVEKKPVKPAVEKKEDKKETEKKVEKKEEKVEEKKGTAADKKPATALTGGKKKETTLKVKNMI